jgi:Ca2+-binding RTX toxin-like protein
MSHSVVFVDSRVLDFDSLLKGLPPGTEVSIIEGNSSGLDQIAEALQGKSGLDAIHIISHGSAGSLYLGTSVLDSQTLPSYGEQLAKIGAALTDSGDLLLYGCNVAQGDAGVQFIGKLAQATGADVAASVDLTGGAQTAGDGLLEYQTDPIETPTISLADYDRLLYALQFAAEDISITGVHFEKELWNLSTLDIANVQVGTSGYSIVANLDTDFHLKYVADLGSNLVDIAYPVEVNATGRSTIRSGELVTIDTSDWGVNSPLVTGQFNLASAGVSLQSTVDLGLLGIDLLDGFSYDPAPYSSDIKLVQMDMGTSAVGAPSAFTFALTSDLKPASPNTPKSAAFKLLDGYLQLTLENPGDIYSDSAHDNLPDALPSVAALGVSPNPVVALSLDLAKLVELGAHAANPALAPFNFSYSFDIGGIEVDATLLEAQLTAAINTANLWTFIPGEVMVSMTSTLGETRTGKLGDSFSFHSPATGSGQFAINASYTLTGKLVSQFGVAFSLDLSWDALKADIGLPLIGQVSVDAGLEGKVTVAQSAPILSPTGLEVPVNNLGTQTQTFYVNYSETAPLAPGDFTGANDFLFIDLSAPVRPSAIDGYTISTNVIALGGGNDVVSVIGGIPTWEWPRNLNGGTGNDTLNLNWSASGTSLSAGKNASSQNFNYSYIGTYYDAGNLFGLYIDSGSSNSFGWDHVEIVNVTGSQKNDFIGYMNGTTYDGQGGIDTFSADWSNRSAAVVWNNTGATFAYAGATISNMERLMLATGSGNDMVTNTAFTTDDVILTGAGNDTINGGAGSDAIDSGAGNDIITLAPDSTSYIWAGTGDDTVNVFGQVRASQLNGGPGTDTLNVDISNNQNDIIYTTIWEILFANRAASFEIINLVGSKFDDYLVYRNGTTYDGKDGTDSFTADWSNRAEPVVWNNTGTPITYDGATVSNVESLHLKTGFGDDLITLKTFDTYNEISTGGGDDTINVGIGVNIIDAGSGDDVINIVPIGRLSIYPLTGGVGVDTLNLDLSSADNANDGLGLRYNLGSFYSSLVAIRTGLTTSFSTGLYSPGFNLDGVTGFEKTNVVATSLSDLLIYQNGSNYDGRDGVDAFYADWSAGTAAVEWNNTGAEFVYYGDNSTNNPVHVSHVERLLLQTGSGDDIITNTLFATDDDIRTGAGHDIISAGRGNDNIDAGSGNDIVNLTWAAGVQERNTVSGGSGTDRLMLDMSVKVYTTIGLSNASGTSTYLNAYSQWDTINTALTAPVKSIFTGYIFRSESNSYTGDVNLTVSEFESIDLVGSSGDDLLIYRNGTRYDGREGADTFYADWSASTNRVVWNNTGAPFTYRDSTLNTGLRWSEASYTQDASFIYDDTTVRNVERLLLQTGSADDVISNTTFFTDDDIRTGAGDDIINTGGGWDRIEAGPGNDVITLDAVATTYFRSTVDGGGGTDTLNLDLSSYTSNVFYTLYNTTGVNAYSTTGIYAHLSNHSALGAIQTALLTFDSAVLAYTESTGIEIINLSGSEFADLLIYQNGTTYNGRGGIDTFYADWSAGTTAVVWNNTGSAFTYNGITVSNVERLLLQTGSGNDVITNTTAATNDDIRTGAGNDTISGGTGADQIDGGSGDDVINIAAVISKSQNHQISGGTGNDTLNLDFSAESSFLSYRIDNSADASTYLNSSSSFEWIQTALTTAIKTAFLSSFTNVAMTNIENINLIGTALGDLLIFQNGSSYDGKGGTDTFYVDWSASTTAVVWNNNGGAFAHNGTTVSNVERLLLQTGSGNDVITTTTFAANDDIRTGAGDDTINTGQGFDSVDTGSGDDVVTIVASMSNLQYQTLNGGTGTDTLNLDLSTAGAMTSFGLGYQIVDAAGATTYLNVASTGDSIRGGLANAVILRLPYVAATAIEIVNLVASSSEDLVIYQNGSAYDGKGGTDTFYADWQASTADITWNNTATSTPQSVNGVSIAGVERLLVTTGTGADIIVNTTVTTNDEIVTGPGSDTVNSGAGNDVLRGDTGADSLTGGAGSDTFRYVTKSDSTVSAFDTIADFESGDSIEFAGMAGVRLLLDLYEWHGDMSSTLNAIGGDAALSNAIVNFTDGTNGWLYVRGAGTGVDFDGTLIKFLLEEELTGGFQATDIKGESGTFSRGNLSVAGGLVSHAEGTAGVTTPFEFTVLRTGDLSAPASAVWAVAGAGTYGANATDFTGAVLPSGVITFSAGEASKVITINVAGDTSGEKTETFSLTLSSPIGATINDATAYANITNDDTSLAVIAMDASKPEGEGSGSTPFTFTVSRNGDRSGVTTVNWAVTGSGAQPANASDFVGGVFPSGSLSFASNTGGKTITVNVAKDGISEADETFIVTLSGATGANIETTSANGTITGVSAASIAGTTTQSGILNATLADPAGQSAVSYQWQASSDAITWNAIAGAIGASFTLTATQVGQQVRVLVNYTDGNSVAKSVASSASAVIAGLQTGTSGSDTLTGTLYSDTLNGLGGTDTLIGLGNADTLDGGAGSDTMTGGGGDDTYMVDSAGDVVTESASEGNDTVRSSINFNLATNGANVENIVYTGSGNFTGTGNGLDNSITGGIGNDTLTGNAGNDTLTGGAGADSLNGGGGSDTVIYEGTTAGIAVNLTTGAVTNDGFGSVDVITPATIENLRASAFNDVVQMSSSTGFVFGRAGNDSLTGGSGSDTFTPGSGNDTVDGGAGTDVVSYSDDGLDQAGIATQGVSVNLATGQATDNWGGTDTLSNIENVVGSALDDVITGNDAVNILNAGAGADTLDGGAGFDFAAYTNATSGLTVDLGNPSNNTGEAEGDTFANIEGLQGSGFNDTLVGDGQNNFLGGRGGADILNGAAGTDYADYRESTSGITVDLANPANNTGNAVGDSYISIEGIRGSSFDDTLVGNSGSNVLRGGAGADVLNGAGGLDMADYFDSATAITVSLFNPGINSGDAAGDTLLSIEAIRSGIFNDTLIGDSGDNALIGSAGADSLDGGSGTDYADYRNATTGITVDLANPANNTDEATGDTFISIEALRGGDFGDTLNGNSEDNFLRGGLGADTLNGGAGHDIASYSNATSGLTADLGNAANNTGEAAGDVFTSIEGLQGSSFNDSLVGNEENNFLIGRLGNDSLMGGGGTDTAAYTGTRSQYTLMPLGTGFTLAGPDGVDTLIGIEFAQFDDLTLSLANFAPIGSVLFSGTVAEDQTLTASNSLEDSDGAGTVAYQWQVLNGATWTNIGVASNSVTLSDEQVGRQIRVLASYTDGHGTLETVASAATTAVVNVNDAPSGAVNISGNAAQGQTLTATSTLADLDGLGTLGYQWQSDGASITGATAATLVLTEAEIGKVISVTASYTDGQGTSESVTSTTTAAVMNFNDSPTGLVSISGTATQGQTLTAAHTLADADGLGFISYQWMAAGSNIVGATDATLNLTEAQVGKAITVAASYTDGRGSTESVASAASSAVANVNDSPTGLVSISGSAAQGQTLTVTHSLGDADGLGAVSFQWKADGIDITGATGTTLILSQALVGKLVTATASYTDAHGTAESMTSSPTNPVANVNDAPMAGNYGNKSAGLGKPLILTPGLLFSDADGDALQFSATGLPVGLAINPTTGEISGTTPESTGLHHISVKATDPGNSVATLNFDLSIAPLGYNLTASVITRGGLALPGVTAHQFSGETPETSLNDDQADIGAAGQWSTTVPDGHLLLAFSRDIADFLVNGAKPVTAADALDALKLSVGLAASKGSSWRELIAADMNHDGRVTAADALEILKTSVGINTVQPSWVFVPADNSINPDLDAMTRTTVSYKDGFNLSTIISATSATITGILVGDVNNSWVIPT